MNQTVDSQLRASKSHDSQLRSNPSISLFREKTKEYFDRADRQPVVVTRGNKMYILINHAQYVSIVNGSRGAMAIHTVVTVVQQSA